MYKRRPLNHLNNWHSYARLFAERLRCAYYVVHTITTAIVLKMQSTSAHVSFECMLFELSQDDMERTHRKTNALAFRTFVYMIYYSHWSFALDKSSKAIFFAPCLKGEYLNWMNERHVELQHNDKCILRKFERRTCMAIYGTLNKQRCLSL